MPVTATKMARAVRNTTMPVTRTSESSYPAEVSISSGSGPCEPSSSSLCGGMFGLQDFCGMRVVELNQRPRLQVGAEVGQPEGDEGHGNSDVLKDAEREVEIPGGVLEVGFNQPEEVEGLGKDHPLADADEALLVALDVARQQQREGDHPVEDEVQGDDDTPVAADAVEIPGDLLGQVARPDDEELAEGEVDVEHHESKRQLAEVVLLDGAQDGGEGLVLREGDGDNDGQCQYRVALADQEQQSVDGGEPGNVHGHDPVDDGGCHGEGVHHDAGAGEVLEFLDPPGRVHGGVGVAAQAHGVEPPRVEAPDGEADDAGDHEHGGIEHPMLELDAVVDGFHLVGGDETEFEVLVDDGMVGPHIEPALAEGDHEDRKSVV